MENEKTLNKDINLIERDNGLWDYQNKFGDLVISTGKQSLRNALIIACLTSWNYLNRKGNPTYETFGNRAYEELKKKKSRMVEYKIRQYFIEVLNRIRRVQKVEDITVYDSPTDLNSYTVNFTVTSINDEIVKGKFTITTDEHKGTSYLTINKNSSTATPINPVKYTITIISEYGVPLANELLYIYDDNDNVLGIAGPSDDKGEISWQQYPLDSFGYQKIHFRFQGNELFNTIEDVSEILSVPFLFELDSEDELFVIKNTSYDLKCWLGEVIVNPNELEYDPYYPMKKYLLDNGNNSYTKYYYEDDEWKSVTDTYTIVNENITPLLHGQLRMIIEDIDNKLYIIEDNVWTELL